MDKKEIQEQEIEALESIYSTETTVICRDYPKIELKIEIPFDNLPKIESNKPLSGIFLHANLPFNYPDSVPLIKIINETHTEVFLKQLLLDAETELINTANENLGMQMLFTLVTKLQDILYREIDNYKTKESEFEQKKKENSDRLELLQFEKSRVTVEQFKKWQIEFMKEIKAKKEAEAKENESQTQSLTGKQLFLRDKSLNVSDLQFLNATEQSTNIEIDAALFEDDISDESVNEDEEST